MNTLILDDLDRKARLNAHAYRVNDEGNVIRDYSIGGGEGEGELLTEYDKEITVFALNNWKLISAAIRKVNLA